MQTAVWLDKRMDRQIPHHGKSSSVVLPEELRVNEKLNKEIFIYYSFLFLFKNEKICGVLRSTIKYKISQIKNLLNNLVFLI